MWTQLLAILLYALVKCGDEGSTEECALIADEFKKAAAAEWCEVAK